MRVILATIFLVFISTSFALGVPKRFGKQISIHSLHLEKISTLGSALKGLIQLADVAELDPVIDVIQGVNQELTELANANARQLASVTVTYEEAKVIVESNIENLQEQLEDSQQALVDAQDSAAHSAELIQENNDAIDTYQQAVADGTALRQQNHEANQQHIANVNEALQAVQAAETILEEIQGQDLVGGSFIQTQKKKFSKALNLVHKKLANTKLRISPTEVYIKQLISIASEVEAQDSVNAEVFDQIFVLVRNLEASLQNEAEQAQQADDEDESNTQAALETLAALIALQQDDLAQNQQDLANSQDEAASLEASIASTQQNLADAEDNLSTLEVNFAVQQQTLQGYIDRLQIDLEVLAKALAFVQSEYEALDDAIAAPITVVEEAPIAIADEPRIVGGDPASWGPINEEVQAPEEAPAAPEGDAQVAVGIVAEDVVSEESQVVEERRAEVVNEDESEVQDESEDEAVAEVVDENQTQTQDEEQNQDV